MIYVVLTLIICIISGYLFKVGCGTISIYKLNMMSVIFYYYLILQCVIGSVLIVNGWESYNWELAAISNPNVRLYGYWAVMYTMIAFPIGMIICNILFKQKNIQKKFQNYCTQPILSERIYNPKIVKYMLILLSIISILSVLYVIIIVREIGLIKMFSESSASELAGFRTEAGRSFSGITFIKNIFALMLCPLMSYIAFGYKIKDNTIFNKIWFYSLFLFSILIVTYNLEKAPIIVYLLGFLFFRIYTGKWLTQRTILILAVCLVFLVSLMYIFIMQTDTEQLAVAILNRITISSVGGLYLDFDIFPAKHDFLYFSSFSDEIRVLFGTEQNERSARIAMIFANPDAVKSGIAGVINCLFIGEAWANWGIIGLIASPIYVGFVIQMFYTLFLNLNKTPLFLGLFIKYTFASSITGGVNDYLYNSNIIFLFFTVSLILIIAQILKRKNAHSNNLARHTHT